MFCSNCGKEVKDGAKFCTNCGAQMPEPSVGEFTQTDESEEDYRLVEEHPAAPSAWKTERMERPEMTRPEVMEAQPGLSQHPQANTQPLLQPETQQGMLNPPYTQPSVSRQPDMQSIYQQNGAPQQSYMQQPYAPQQLQNQPGMTQSYMNQQSYSAAQKKQGSGKKKPNWKLWVPVSVLAALLVVAGILLLFLKKDSDDTESAASKRKKYELGDEVQAGDLVFTVYDIYATYQIYDEGKNDLSYSAQGMFVILEVNVENTGKKAASVSKELFRLENSSGDRVKLSYVRNDELPDKLSAGEDQNYVLIYEEAETDDEYILTVGSDKDSRVINLELTKRGEKPTDPSPSVSPVPSVDWSGTWTRIGDSYYDSAVVEITDLGEGSIYFIFNANTGANTGETEGIATAIGNQAAYEDESYGFTISFTRNDDTLDIVTGGNFYGELGEGVTIDGSYMLGEPVKEAPTLTELGILNGTSQEQVFRELVMEDYDQFINSCQTVIMEADLDGYGAAVYSGGVRGLYTIMECIIMVAPGDQIWAAVIDDSIVKYYTNTADTNFLPLTFENWRSDFSYYEVQYMNYIEASPEATTDYNYDDGDSTGTSDYYFNPYYITAVDDIAFSPREAYYEDGYFYLVMYIYNGRSYTAYDISDVDIIVANDYETIAGGSFGTLQDATIEPYSYITWTFRFTGDAIYVSDADLTSIHTDSYCSYTY